MRLKRILGVIAIICGIILFVFSGYITKQVAIGRGEIYRGQQRVNSAQSDVNRADSAVDNSTQMKGLGGLLTSGIQGDINSGQARVNAGKRKANYYDRLASNLRIGGSVLLIVGILLFFSNRIRNFFKKHS